MGLSGFPTIRIEKFMGLLNYYDARDIPKEYSPVCENVVFKPGRVASRPGTETFITLGGGTDIYHSELYLLASPFTKFYLFLMQDHNLYYSTGGARTLLLTGDSDTTNFVVTSYGNFVYIFQSDGYAGTTAMYVWDPTQLPTVQVDLATITPAAIGTMAAATGGAGEVDAGVHLIRVVFETRTGYRSSPTTGSVSYTATANDSIDLTNIPLYAGEAGHVAAECTKRHVVMTPAGLEEYYIALTINDNTTATGTIDISDVQLVQQTNVDAYFNYMSPLPDGR